MPQLPSRTILRRFREAVRALCADFPCEYWRQLDSERTYPTDFVDALTAPISSPRSLRGNTAEAG